MTPSPYVATERLPRPLAEDVIWLGGCSDVAYWGPRFSQEPVRRHQYCNAYLVLGEDRTLMVETGHAAHWSFIQRQLDQALDGRPVDYIFPTHQEIPHCGNLGRLMARYPKAQVVGNVQDYHLFHPELAPSRLMPRSPGDTVDLGGTSFSFIEPVWHDLRTTLWGYNSRSRVLFAVDGLEHSHEHEPRVCGQTSAERGTTPDPRLIHVLFPWAAHTYMQPYCDRFDGLRGLLEPEVVAPSHGTPIVGNTDEVIAVLLDVLRHCGIDG